MPRGVRTQAKKLDATVRQLETELDRAPGDEELADRISVSLPDFCDIADGVRAVTVTSLSAHRNHDTRGGKNCIEPLSQAALAPACFSGLGHRRTNLARRVRLCAQED